MKVNSFPLKTLISNLQHGPKITSNLNLEIFFGRDAQLGLLQSFYVNELSRLKYSNNSFVSITKGYSESSFIVKNGGKLSLENCTTPNQILRLILQ